MVAPPSRGIPRISRPCVEWTPTLSFSNRITETGRTDDFAPTSILLHRCLVRGPIRRETGMWPGTFLSLQRGYESTSRRDAKLRAADRFAGQRRSHLRKAAYPDTSGLTSRGSCRVGVRSLACL